MTFPTPFKVGHRAYSSTTEDDYGREVAVYTPAADLPANLVPVYGWGSPNSTEPKVAGHDRVVVEVELYTPPVFNPGAHDLIDIPDGPQAGRYEVVGLPEDYTHGPFGFQPGYVINLRRVEG